MFHDAFRDAGRTHNFSYEGRDALFHFLEEMETECQEGGIELDIRALCCEYAEESIQNVLKEYNLESIEELEEKTIVIWHDNKNVLYQQY